MPPLRSVQPLEEASSSLKHHAPPESLSHGTAGQPCWLEQAALSVIDHVARHAHSLDAIKGYCRQRESAAILAELAGDAPAGVSAPPPPPPPAAMRRRWAAVEPAGAPPPREYIRF